MSPAPGPVVLVTIDTLRADHLGCYGYPRPTSPFLDRLAASGVLFEEARASVSHTAPSHASLFTSLQPQQHGVLRNGESLDPEIASMASLFRRAGYRTAAFVSAGFLGGLASGFEVFEAMPAAPAPEVLARARRWLGSEGDRPAFSWIHLFDVHEWHRDSGVDWESVDELRRTDPLTPSRLEALVRSHGVELQMPFGRAFDDALHRYDGQLASTDRALASFFESPEVGRAGDPLWIVTSDHGEGLGGHGAMGHGKHIYEEQLRVPLILHSERLPGGRRVPEPVALVDLLPTLVDLLSLPAPVRDAWQGRSLIPALEGEELPARPIWAERRPADARRVRRGWHAGDLFAWRRGRYKLIAGSRGLSELYDLVEDPLERVDLGLRQPDLVERLQRELDAHLALLRASSVGGGDQAIDEQHRAELEALGYL